MPLLLGPKKLLKAQPHSKIKNFSDQDQLSAALAQFRQGDDGQEAQDEGRHIAPAQTLWGEAQWHKDQHHLRRVGSKAKAAAATWFSKVFWGFYHRKKGRTLSWIGICLDFSVIGDFKPKKWKGLKGRWFSSSGCWVDSYSDLDFAMTVGAHNDTLSTQK